MLKTAILIFTFCFGPPAPVEPGLEGSGWSG
jgi:hypothetical protein